MELICNGSEYRYSVTNHWTEYSNFFLNINSVYFQFIYIYINIYSFVLRLRSDDCKDGKKEK